MKIKLALCSASKDILRQARKEFSALAIETGLELEMAFFANANDLVDAFCEFDIACVHEVDFISAMPVLTAVVKDRSDPGMPATHKLVIGMFSIPVKPAEFMMLIAQLRHFSTTIDIPISKGRKTEIAADIIYFENINRRIHIKTAAETYPTNLTLKTARDLTVAHPFASPYVSYLVNLAWVESIASKDVVLKNKETIPLSQKKAADFRRLYGEYLSKLQ
ncbi:MAG: LytTR family transcriptional regulator DNA-binding domain-containing protein [Defluviitaleaceae bacterium]|nr:LytTR family transcriptional regulator DNA-binding domain-containing protein [Defluviitaleaceae bacterium]